MATRASGDLKTTNEMQAFSTQQNIHGNFTARAGVKLHTRPYTLATRVRSCYVYKTGRGLLVGTGRQFTGAYSTNRTMYREAPRPLTSR